ncbi:MAG: asparagine--tRNA ligase, partial [Bacteroidia bacterium]
MTIKEILATAPEGQEIVARGWVRTFRSKRFIALNDGSTINNLQVVVDFEKFPEEELKRVTTSACLQVKGKLVASVGSGQTVELEADEVEVLGDSDAAAYPIQPKAHSLEFLREQAHFRWRTNTYSAIFRIRHHLSFSIHEYFHKKGFFNVHSPILTGSDAEGAGEMFQVTTLDMKKPPLTEEGEVDYKEDFFGKPANLTVSGQLQAEIAALALGKVYTFGPTFRAENSNTTRHLAEFWMVEPEVAFAELEDNKNLAEDFLKYLIQSTLEHCADDLKFLDERLAKEESQKAKNERREMGLLDTLKFCIENPFARITYTEAVEILQRSKPYKEKKFQYLVDWVKDLQSEHERYLV